MDLMGSLPQVPHKARPEDGAPSGDLSQEAI